MQRRWLEAYALVAFVALVIASTSFVAWRNRSFGDRERERAQLAAEAVAAGEVPAQEGLAAGLGSPATGSETYPFLRRRTAAAPRGVDADGTRPLGGPQGDAQDKLLYDAAKRAEERGGFVQFSDDGTDRVIAALPTADGIAVAVTRPASGPEPYPWLVVLGLLSLGAVVCAAGALVGGPAGGVGLALGGSGLAVPAYLWAGVLPAALILASAAAAGWAAHRGALDRAFTELSRQRVAYGFLAPAALAMMVLVATPFAIGLVLGFYDHHHGQWTFVGLANFGHILSGGGHSFADPLNFWFILGVTVVWTAANVALHVTIGVALALVLRQRWLAGRGIYRMLLILPWAIPNYITALIWRGMFQGEYGAINSILHGLGLGDVSWFSSWSTAFTANVVTNTWLGFPFMMVVALGALESIPRDMYEAAEVDGASAWQRFRQITLPHLRPALGPAVVLGAIWTFNMFNVIYLVSNGQPGGSTDILITDAYRWAFERGERYGMASAYATIIFLILLLWTVFGTRIGRKEEP